MFTSASWFPRIMETVTQRRIHRMTDTIMADRPPLTRAGLGIAAVMSYLGFNQFPSGFHGHFRSHIRNDICQEYRMEAKPPPPKAFTQRIKEHPTKHIFSRHDNRHIFPSSVFSFENGLGKKKLLKHRESYNFIHWTPLEEELRRQRPLISTYRTDFWRKNEEMGKVAPQILVPRLTRATSASCSELTTTYRHMLRSHSNLQASQNSTTTDITLISNNNKAGAAGLLLQRAMSAPYKRLTVSDCLVWCTPDSVKRESVQTTEVP